MGPNRRIKEKARSLPRRDFVIGTLAAGTVFLSGCKTGRSGDFLSEDASLKLKALCDQIVPGDHFPSASEAGVLDYIDRQLARHYRRHQKAYLQGLEQANRICRERFGCDLERADSRQQLEVTKAIEQQQPEFFELVRQHTLEGYYGSPRHGGNRDAVSWRMLGLAEPPLNGRAQYSFRKDLPS